MFLGFKCFGKNFAFFFSIRYWTLVWHGTLMMRWPATWPPAGTVLQRSCWTGCTTTWQVQDSNISLLFPCWKPVQEESSYVCLCFSGYLVSGLHHGGASNWENSVPWHRPYPFHRVDHNSTHIYIARMLLLFFLLAGPNFISLGCCLLNNVVPSTDCISDTLLSISKGKAKYQSI